MRLLRSAYNNNLPMYLTISSEIPLVEDAIIIFTSRILSSFINTCYTPRSNVHDSDRNIYIYITVSFNRKPRQPRFLVSLLFPPFHHRSNDHDLARYAKSIFLRTLDRSFDLSDDTWTNTWFHRFRYPEATHPRDWSNVWREEIGAQKWIRES